MCIIIRWRSEHNSKCVATSMSCCEVRASSLGIMDWEVSRRISGNGSRSEIRESVMFPNQYWTFLFCSFSWGTTWINSEVCGSSEASSVIQCRRVMRIEESISGNMSLATLELNASSDDDDEGRKCISALTVPLQS